MKGSKTNSIVCSTLVSLFLGTALTAQVARDVPLKNWPTPLYWQPTPAKTEVTVGRLNAEVRTPSPEAATPAGSLVFVAMTPCRVVDTRASQMFPSPFGMPSLVANATRSFPIQSSGNCPIPSAAQAYSFNVTVIPPAGLGYLTIWPTGPSQPNAVTLDDITGDLRNNAAIVPAGTPNGSVDVHVNAATDLVIDINGYFAPSTGITLAPGTAGAPSLSFSGDAGTGIFSSGTGTLNLATGGTNRLTVRSDGDLDLAGNIRKSGALFLHNLGNQSLGVGIGALGVNTGTYNTASGFTALFSNTSGGANTAIGFEALFSNTTGLDNNATGAQALFSTTSGSGNTAIGLQALYSNIVGNYNVAFGGDALYSATGNSNTALGTSAGVNITTGSNNVAIANYGASTDSGVVRIGTTGAQTSFFAAGIKGVTTGQQNAVNVMIDSNGQLGTMNSSRRFKEDVQDMAAASSGLLRLRPVTYRYQKPYADGSKPIDYGLIAEEVAEVYPDLVVKGADGQIETVQYHKLVPMLLNELQKVQGQLSTLQKMIETHVAGQQPEVSPGRPASSTR